MACSAIGVGAIAVIPNCVEGEVEQCERESICTSGWLLQCCLGMVGKSLTHSGLSNPARLQGRQQQKSSHNNAKQPLVKTKSRLGINTSDNAQLRAQSLIPQQLRGAAWRRWLTIAWSKALFLDRLVVSTGLAALCCCVELEVPAVHQILSRPTIGQGTRDDSERPPWKPS